MHFLYPEWLNAFLGVGFVVVLMILSGARKRRLLKRFGRLETLKQLTTSYAPAKARLKSWLLTAVLCLLVLALAQPQWGEEKKELKRKGVEIMFLVDTSLSMLAEDVKPSRIEQAKLLMKTFLGELKGDRVGIVSFAGSGFIQSPLTLDYDAFTLFSNAIEVGYIPDAGTSLSEAIRTAVRAFPESKKKHHVIVLLTDGEHFEGDIKSSVLAAQEAQVRIYAIGIGTEEGAPIPVKQENRTVTAYKKDRSGQVVITKLNQPLLEEISTETGGRYFPASASLKEVSWVYQDLQNIEKQEFRQQMVIEREDHFQAFLLIAFMLLMAEMWVSDARKGRP